MNFGEKLKAIRLSLELTQDELAARLGTTKQAISRYENSEREPNLRTAREFSEKLGVDLTTLADDTLPLRDISHSSLSPLPVSRSFPLVGDIACGTPILADQNITEYINFPGDLNADFCLRCRGDSMIDARIHDGDVVFIRQQPEVENGEIAAVLIGEETTLKRVYRDRGVLTLMPANPAYPPMVYSGDQLDEIRILGKAVSFLSAVK